MYYCINESSESQIVFSLLASIKSISIPKINKLCIYTINLILSKPTHGLQFENHCLIVLNK